MNRYYIQQNFIHFNFKFNPSIIAEIKEIKDRKYNPNTKEWYVPNSIQNAKQINSIISKYDFKQDNQSTFFGEGVKSKISEIDEEKGIELIKQNLLKLNLGITPREYQWKDIYYMTLWRNMINGSDMGCGKSPTTIFTAEYNNWFPCLIVCPSSTKYQWKELWLKANPNRVIDVIESKRDNNWNADVVIINYDLLGVSGEEVLKYGKLQKEAIPKFPELIRKWKYAVFDEIHYVKSSKSLRYKIASKIANKSEIACGLTGTLSLNKTEEIIKPLTIIKRFKELFNDWEYFVTRYCNGKQINGYWDVSGSSNLIELNSILRNNCYIRREIGEVNKFLPPIQEINHFIPLSNIKEYQKAESGFLKYLIDKGFSEEDILSASTSEALVQRSKLRQLSIKGKMKGIEEWIDDFLESSNNKLMVCGWHTEPLVKLSEKYKSKLINGSVNALKKREIVKDFAVNKDRLLFAQIMSVGTGTDGLQQSCHNMLIIEQPEVPALEDQLIARLKRDGQLLSVSIHRILCKESIDMKILDTLYSKSVTTSAVNKGVNITDNQ